MVQGQSATRDLTNTDDDGDRVPGHSLLMQACMRGDVDEVQRQLASGASAFDRGTFGTTVLIKAAEEGHSAILSLLLSHGVPVNIQDDNGDSALLCACRMGHVEAVRVLLSAGADSGLTNAQGNNALDAALEARNLLDRPEVSELLLRHRRGCEDVLPTPPPLAGAEEVDTRVAVPWPPPQSDLLNPQLATAALVPTATIGGTPPADGACSAAAAGSGAASAAMSTGGGGGTLTGGSSGMPAGGGGGSGGSTCPNAPVLRLRREEWAMDRNYPQCHLCKTNFTIFNRRHHCRICGLVFCEKCTSNTVSTAGARLEGGGGTFASEKAPVRVRVCTTCAALHAEHSGVVLAPVVRGPTETREVGGSYVSSFAEGMRRRAAPALAHMKTAVDLARAATFEASTMKLNPAAGETSLHSLTSGANAPLSVNSRASEWPDEDMVSSRTVKEEAENSTEAAMGAAGSRNAASPVKIHGCGLSGGFGGGNAGLAETNASSSVLVSESGVASVESRRGNGGAGHDTSEEEEAAEGAGAAADSSELPSLSEHEVRRAEGDQAETAGAEDAKGDSAGNAPLLADVASRHSTAREGGGKQGGGKESSTAQDLGHGSASTPATAAITPGLDKVLQKRPQPLSELPRIDMPASDAEEADVAQEHLARLQGWREMSLRRAIFAQLTMMPSLPSQWQGTLELLATRAADSLRPDTNASINTILKIKTLPGGSRADSHYVDGLVCRLKLAHKCMRTELRSPRILLLKASLEHEESSFSSSLDSIRQQEDEHMEMIVGEMAKLRVDLLLVGGSVCYTAKEKLLKRGIALAVGVKPSVLARVSRCTNTLVLLSPAQVLGATPGTCGRWRVENVSVSTGRTTSPDVARSTPGGGLASPGTPGAAPGLLPYVSEAGGGGGVGDGGMFCPSGGMCMGGANRKVTLMYFERCPSHLLATIVLRGGEHEAMKQLKAMLASAAHVAADLATETSYIFDFGGTMPLPSVTALDSPHGAAVAAEPLKSGRPLGLGAEGMAVGRQGGAGSVTKRASISPASSPPTGPPAGYSVEEVLGSSSGVSKVEGLGTSKPEGRIVDDTTASDVATPEPVDARVDPIRAEMQHAHISAEVAEVAPLSHAVSSIEASLLQTHPATLRNSERDMHPPPLSFEHFKRDLPARDADEFFYADGGGSGNGGGGSGGDGNGGDGNGGGSSGGGVARGSQDRGVAEVVVAGGGMAGGGMARGGASGGSSTLVCSSCEEHPADRLWFEDARTLRVATCWKRWDVLEAPCQVPRERSLYYNREVPGASHANLEDNQTLGQFLYSHCFNLRRQCTNPKCKESVLRHEQCFFHHGARLAIKVMQLAPDQPPFPSDGLCAWAVCRACPPPAKPSPRLPLSPSTCSMSLGRFLEANFYNSAAASRALGCPHSLHSQHVRYVGCGNLVCSISYQPCVVFGITPPLPPRNLRALPLTDVQTQPLPSAPPLFSSLFDGGRATIESLPHDSSSASSTSVATSITAVAPDHRSTTLATASLLAAHALRSKHTENEVARGVQAFAGSGAEGGGGDGGMHLEASGGDVRVLGSQDVLCSMMRWADAMPKVELRYEDEAMNASGAGPTSPLLAGVTPVRAVVLYPAPFAALRERFCEGGDRAFINSLLQATPWYSGRGGKSGSTFLKTMDDRYLLKQVPRSEFWAFHEHAPTYFMFVSNTPTTLPSVLVKILGAVLVEYRNADGLKVTQYLLIQENLFYGKNVSRMCDLKGAHRNRGGEDENETVLDENLFRFNNGYPLLLSEAAKQRLTRALWNDTLFLASINVMDYSLLVGMVQTRAPAATTKDGEPQGADEGDWTLMVGLIDYCRQYTWKEEAERQIKRATVIQPKQYKRRFREALNRYFMASIEKYCELHVVG